MSTEAAAGAGAVAAVTAAHGVYSELKKWIKSYNAEQKEQMRRIHALYSKELQMDPDEAKSEFKMKDTDYSEPEWRTEDINFDIDYYHKELKQLSNRPLTKHIRQILPKVTAWQQLRMKKFRSPPRNDPVNLIMEEFKRWLIHAAEADLKVVAKEIQQRIRYIVGLQQAEEFDDSIRAGFLILEQGLQRRLYPEVVKKLSQNGVQEFIEELINRCTNLVLDGVQFAFYVLRSNKKPPKTLSIEDVRVGIGKYQECMDTRTGLLLWALVWSPSFQYLRPPLMDDYPPNLPREFQLNPIPTLDTVVDEERKKPLFMDPNGEPFVPNILFEKLTKKERRKMDGARAKAHQILAYFDKAEVITGISRAFSTKDFGLVERRRLLRDFVLLHGLLHKMVDFVLVCKDIQRVAKIASELLLYGVAKQEVLNTMLLGSMLLGQLMKLSRKIYDTSAQRAFEVDPKFKEWRINRLQAVPMFYALQDKIAECIELCQQVDKNASRDFEDIVKEAKQQSALMIHHARSFYKQNSFLGIELEEPELLDGKEQLLVVSGSSASSSIFSIASATPPTLPSLSAPSSTALVEQRKSISGGPLPITVGQTKTQGATQQSIAELVGEKAYADMKDKDREALCKQYAANPQNLPVCEFGMKCELLKATHPAHDIHLKRFHHKLDEGCVIC